MVEVAGWAERRMIVEMVLAGGSTVLYDVVGDVYACFDFFDTSLHYSFWVGLILDRDRLVVGLTVVLLNIIAES